MHRCITDIHVHVYNESTAGADVSVEVPKLHNIKLQYTHYKNIFALINFAARRQDPESQGNSKSG